MLLKHIFSDINISNLLTHVKKYFYYNHFLYIEEIIQKFLACSIDKAFIIYQCPLCGSAHKFKISCKSRLCPACGKKYAALWADKTAASLINTKHRAILFTIPKEIREFFFYDRTLLTKLTYAVNDIFKYQFNNIKSKNQRVHKIDRYSKKYFTNSDILHYGLITVIHTFGRDLKWNPHIHAIVTLGGFNKNYKYLNKKYFHVLLLDNGKNLLLILLKVVIIKIKSLKRKLKLLLLLFIKKIQDFSDNKVTFYYEDLSNNKEKVEVTMEVEEFLSKLIIHIPPKNFKMIRRFGIYSRNIKKELKFIISKIKKYKLQYTKTTFYQLEIWKTFGINPFYCFNCKIKMKVRRISYFNISKGSICWKEYCW